MIVTEKLEHILMFCINGNEKTIPNNYKQDQTVSNFIKLVSPEISHNIGIVHIGDKGPSPVKNNFLKFLKNL